jgi:hypothetical protein
MVQNTGGKELQWTGQMEDPINGAGYWGSNIMGPRASLPWAKALGELPAGRLGVETLCRPSGGQREPWWSRDSTPGSTV